MTSRTPERSRAATVRRRRRLATMRMGGRKESWTLFKGVGSGDCGDGFEAIVGFRPELGEPRLLTPHGPA
jgi:hypothetical protein